MKIFFRIYIALVAILISSSALLAQTSNQSGLRSISGDMEKAQERFRAVTNEAGESFKRGILNLNDNKKQQAKEEFDKSVTAFLKSGINLSGKQNGELQKCYSE